MPANVRAFFGFYVDKILYFIYNNHFKYFDNKKSDFHHSLSFLTNISIKLNPTRYKHPRTKYNVFPVIKLANVGPIIPATAHPDKVIACTVLTLVLPNRLANSEGKQLKLPP